MTIRRTVRNTRDDTARTLPTKRNLMLAGFAADATN
eukprot:CAMPEP_0168223606 /NCGR_PEP_ID=MMETSP0140_2-20121125/11461_1 /TAXON_ID=44445 /ORGANISM="Pseudo-nitzschia australis, Strain 10249 10 AB" /LENGTH=35 /DNA_ID= /DNA_START= /DNA_END= /DNA_ORIENTATION=